METLGLQRAKLGGFFFTTANQPGFLNVQITQLPFVLEKRFELNDAGAVIGMVVFESLFELLLELDASVGIHRHLETGDADQTPSGVCQRLDKLALAEALRTILVFVLLEMQAISGCIVRVEEHGAAGQTGFDSVQAGDAFAFRSFRTGGELGIGVIDVSRKFAIACADMVILKKKMARGSRSGLLRSLPERSTRKSGNEPGAEKLFVSDWGGPGWNSG